MGFATREVAEVWTTFYREALVASGENLLDHLEELGDAMGGDGGHARARKAADKATRMRVGDAAFRAWRYDWHAPRPEPWRPTDDDPKRSLMHLDKRGGRVYGAATVVTFTDD